MRRMIVALLLGVFALSLVNVSGGSVLADATKVTIDKKGKSVKIDIAHRLDSKDKFQRFREENARTAEVLLKEKIADALGVVTFTEPLTFEDAKKLVQEYGMKPGAFRARLVSKKTGQVITFGLVPEEGEVVPEAAFGRMLERVKDLDPELAGLYMVEGLIPSASLLQMQNNAKVLVVDLTPEKYRREVRQELPDAIILLSVSDLFWQAEDEGLVKMVGR